MLSGLRQSYDSKASSSDLSKSAVALTRSHVGEGIACKIVNNVTRTFKGGILRIESYFLSFSLLLIMTQRNILELAKQKIQKFHWSVWFPYPVSWFRTLILVPIAFPGARLIVFGFLGAIISAIGSNPMLLIFSVLFGLLIPTVILSFVYHFFWFIWQKQPSSNRLPKWIPCSSSLWEGFYGTVVIGLSFLPILTIFVGLGFLSCKLSHKAAEELSGCVGGVTGRAAGAIFGSTDNIFDLSSGRGVVVKREDVFVTRPWFVIWIVSAAYIYQAEYQVRQRLIPKLKVALQNYQSRSPVLSPQTDTFKQAVNKAMTAANLTQVAKSQDEWKKVVSEWQEAIALMKSVRYSSPNYPVAQQKIVEYQRNLNYAQKNAVERRSATS